MQTVRPRPSRSVPKEEAAIPLPRLEHTPPETNIYLFMYKDYRIIDIVYSTPYT